MFSKHMYVICSNYLKKSYFKTAVNIHNKCSYKCTNLPIIWTISDNNLFLWKSNLTLQKALLSSKSSPPSKPSSNKPASKTPTSTCETKTPSKDKRVCDTKPTTVSKAECVPKIPSKDKPVCDTKPTTVSKAECVPKTPSKDKTPCKAKSPKSSQPSTKALCETKPPTPAKHPTPPKPPTPPKHPIPPKPQTESKPCSATKLTVSKTTSEPKCISGTTPPSNGTPGGPSTKIIRQEPGKVRLGFIPDEWFMLFYKKTGVTGMGTFCFTTMIFFMSKEYYILEHEYYGGLSMIILCVLGVKYVGPELARFIDNEIDEYEKTWTSTREHQQKVLTNAIENEKKLQDSMEGQLMLVEAKRENVQLQLEAAYRERLMHAYKETKKRLDYCATIEIVERAFARRTMSQWVVDQVKSSFDKDIEKLAVDKCLEDLKTLAKTFEELKGPYKDDDDDSKKSK